MKKLSEIFQREDWLKRNGDSYTHHRVTNRINWEDRLTKGEPFSKFLMPGLSTHMDAHLQLLYARHLCGQVLQNMNPTNKPIRLIFGKDNVTDSTSFVSVSLSPLDDNYPLASFHHRLDVMLGATVHEMAHVVYTKTDVFGPVLDSIKDKMSQHLLQTIHNVVEDERIEMHIGEHYPGYSNYLAQIKSFVFDFMLQHKLEDEQQKVDPRFAQVSKLFMCFLYMVRYPKSADPADVDVFENELLEIKDILTPYPHTPQESIDASVKILDVFLRFQQDEEQESGSGNTDEDGENEEGEGDEGSEGSEGKSSGGKGKGKIRIGVRGNSGGGQGEDGEDEGDENGGSADDTGNETEVEISEDELAAIAKALKEMLDTIQENTITESKEQAVQIQGSAGTGPAGDLNSMDNDSVEEHVDQAMQWMQLSPELENATLVTRFHDHGQKVGKADRFYESLDRVKMYTGSLRARLQMFNRNRTDTYRGLHEGTFDDEMIVDAVIGERAVYHQQAKIYNNGATIGLLIDESGSMSGRWQRAMDVAVLMQQALQGVNQIDFYCYGHTTEYSGIPGYTKEATSLIAYYEGNKRGKQECLGGIYAHSTNRDGHALLECAGRMRRFTKQPIVLFMVSDGMPSASVPHRFSTGEEYVRHAVAELKKNDVHVIHIAIDDSVKSERMFTDYVKFTDMGNLVHNMTALLTRVITKIQAPEIEFE
jgi:cobalamin biosynthesis protein CobT